MDFVSAKLQINPDPNWWPSRGSAEYQEILSLMSQSGTVHLADKIPLALEADKGHMWKHGRYVNPLNAVMNDIPVSKVSKNEFMTLPSNKKKVEEHLQLYGIPVKMVDKPAKTCISAQPTAPPKDKKISKKDFLNLGQNKAYVEQHINYYK